MTVSQPSSDRAYRNRSRFKIYALATAGAAAMTLMAQSVYAQDASKADSIEQVTVTGTRVVRDGYNAPTPVTVLGTQDIQQTAPANLADYVNQVPAVQGSTTAANSSGSVSTGGAGVNALNLRQLGTTRTLVLLDSHRVPASTNNAQIDVNTIPQQLVKRVDVVTGGASADYGSDAIGGVVNFILDKDYSGVKGSAEYGQSDDGLIPSYKAGLTFGTPFDGGRGHFLLSGEWNQIAGTPRNYVPNWEKPNYFLMPNPTYATGNGQPYYIVNNNIGFSQTSPGGLIVGGPLRGTTFGVNATVGQFNFGQVSGPFMLGGDTDLSLAGQKGGDSLAPQETRESIYTRAAYNITPDLEVTVDAFVNRYKGKSAYVQPDDQGGIFIKSDNAFLPASVRTALAAAGQTQFEMGSINVGFPQTGNTPGREAQHIGFGADGTFNLLTDWKFDFYGQFSGTNTNEKELPNWNNARLALAQDAVFAPAGNAAGIAAGTIACRSTLTSPGNGCVPLSRIGVNGGTQDPAAYAAGQAYVFDTPYRLERFREQDFSFNITGNPFNNWQGPVSVAFGGEWRLESSNGFVPTQYQNGWHNGNFLPTVGHFSVAEGYLETVVPLMAGMDFNGAVRYAAYSTAGGTTTWKAGLTYAPPFLPDIKLRATYSHDLRAPTNNDLFNPGGRISNAVSIYGKSFPITYESRGNPNLKPENANSLGLGIVLTPTFLDGFTASVDYFNVVIKQGITTPGLQTEADLCYINGLQNFCNLITYVGGTVATPTNGGPQLQSFVRLPVNLASQKESGIDFDVTYHVPLDAFDGVLGKIPGDLTLHGLATNYASNITNTGYSPPTEAAGVNQIGAGGVPSWVYRVTATYHTDPWTFYVAGRGVSAGLYSNEWTQCTTGCPAFSTAPYYSINNNQIPGGFWIDTNVTYAFDVRGVNTELYFSIKNLFDTDPPLIGSGPPANLLQLPSYPLTNISQYDFLGRLVRIGLRFDTN